MSETNIVTDVLDVFRASGFEVRESNFGATPETVIYGTADNAGVLMESVLEHFSKATEGADSCAQREKCEVKNLAHAGVTAEPAGHVPIPRATLLMIYEAMNYMGDKLNDMDVCEDEDEEATTPAFDAIRELLDDSYAAPTIPAQVPAAEVRAQALEEAARATEQFYTGHGQQPDDPHPDAVLISETVFGIAHAIRALKVRSTATSNDTAIQNNEGEQV